MVKPSERVQVKLQELLQIGLQIQNSISSAVKLIKPNIFEHNYEKKCKTDDDTAQNFEMIEIDNLISAINGI